RRTGSFGSRGTFVEYEERAPMSGTSGGRLQAEDRARDDDALDLARPFVDLGDLRVAVVALDGELLRVAVAAENLDRLRRLAARHLGREELRLRARLGHR